MKRLSVIPLATLLAVACSEAPTQTEADAPIQFRIEEGDLPVCTAWAKVYHGPAQDGGATSVRQTPDGGFIAVGWTRSFGAGGTDLWVLKLDACGDVEWEQTYGGGGDDLAFDVELTDDGGYILTSQSNSFGAAAHEPVVLKLDALGNVLWQKAYRTSRRDWGFDVEQTVDGGYILAGGAEIDGVVRGRIIKLDVAGNIEWERTYGGNDGGFILAIEVTTDQGYIVAGVLRGSGADQDLWVLKLDMTGAIEWQRTFGGGGIEQVFDVHQTANGDYVVAGSTGPSGFSSEDVWIIRLNPAGGVIWEQTYGGEGQDFGEAIQETSDGGFIVAASTASFGPVRDMWVLRLTGDGSIVWQKTYDSGGHDATMGFGAVQQTTDGGYIAVELNRYAVGGGAFEAVADPVKSR